jgi:hypothetical protein
MAAILLAAAGVVAAGALDSAAPAKADEDGQWVAIAWSPDNGKYAWQNNAWDQQQAQDTALMSCANFGGTHCEITGFAHNACVAMAISPGQAHGWWGPTIDEASQAALQKNGGGAVEVARCSSGGDGWG